MRKINAYSCDWYIGAEKSNLAINVPSTCDFSATNGEFAWVDELTQGIYAGDEDATVKNSQFHHKKTEAYCREVAAFSQDLNNGRAC